MNVYESIELLKQIRKELDELHLIALGLSVDRSKQFEESTYMWYPAQEIKELVDLLRDSAGKVHECVFEWEEHIEQERAESKGIMYGPKGEADAQIPA